ncbi:efflux RND transporter periplasmic adaptor subunit [Roseovarius sp. MMSF_3281]|uniref:efflux RND transporter periplasmic adaptor subunit n=1 Tax=Roseovarius sp. MMSF_3281 TaxID=3046694 RepID=UPI0035322AE1
MNRSILVSATLVLGLTVSSLFAGRALSQQAQGPAPVVVVTLQAQTVTLTSTLPGRVAASAEAEVRPQVNGIITERLFREGAHVEAGDALYRIDPATYSAAVEQAQAAVTQAQVQLDAAEIEAERLVELRERNVTSERAFDDAKAVRDTAAAALEVARAQLRSAEIELERTTIRARLSGEIGLARTSPGALVTASQAEPMAVIRDIDPVYVDVTQSAADLLRWTRGQTEDQLSNADTTVRLTLADGSDYGETGKITAAEPSVDPQTGVVVLRMQFDNPHELLLPGMYVQVELPVGTAEDVLLVPQEAVQRDRRGRPITWVVNGDNVVKEQQVTILQDRGSDWVVTGGLEDGDRVIVAGFQKTAVGATVAPEERPNADADASGEQTEEPAEAGEQTSP